MMNSKIKISLTCPGLGHVKRGIETWTEDLARALRGREGLDVTLYKGAGERTAPYEEVIPCLKRTSALNKWLVRYKLPFCWRFGLATTYTLEEMTFAWNIFPELLWKQYDIIHTQDPDVAYILQTVHRWGWLKSRVILAHGTEEPFKFLSHFDYVQHLAPYHLDEAKLSGVRNKQAFAIGNFIDTDVFKPGLSTGLRDELGIPSDAFVVLCVAAIKRHHKRVDYLIDEVSRINDEKVYLLVAGSGVSETEELIGTAKARLGKRAVFLTDFPHDRIREVYAAADLFVLCSLKEMMPIALLEAISSGLPALVHKYPVEEWMIGEGGEAIDMSREGELARAIEKYRDPALRREKSLKAREHAAAHFGKDVIVNEIIKMYEQVTSDKRQVTSNK